MKLTRLFIQHPASVGETYTQHLAQAAVFGVRMLAAGAACLLHAVFPFWCVNTGSDAVRHLHDSMSARRKRAIDHTDIRDSKASDSFRP